MSDGVGESAAILSNLTINFLVLINYVIKYFNFFFNEKYVCYIR